MYKTSRSAKDSSVKFRHTTCGPSAAPRALDISGVRNTILEFLDSAAALHLLHVRLDEYGEAEASLALGIKLNALPVRPLTDGWWRPRAELEAARNSVQVRGGP